jgi:hypothetical protein
MKWLENFSDNFPISTFMKKLSVVLQLVFAHAQTERCHQAQRREGPAFVEDVSVNFHRSYFGHFWCWREVFYIASP